MKNLKLLFIITILGIACFMPSLAQADEDKDFPFDKRISYDLYVQSGVDYPTVIKDVEVVGFEQISGKLFLVIKSYGFNLKDVEGYVLFESVVAILPERQFKVRKDHKSGVSY